jgi:hypothetical protein
MTVLGLFVEVWGNVAGDVEGINNVTTLFYFIWVPNIVFIRFWGRIEYL